MKYDIAFSYASEQIEIVNKFKKRLTMLGLEVFIDDEHPELFVFNNVPEVLKSIYENSDTAMLIFLSEEYTKKNFTMFEGHIALDRLIKGEKISVIRIDDSKLPWLPASHHFFDIRKKDITYICNAIASALKKNTSTFSAKNFFNSLNRRLSQEEVFIEDQKKLSCCVYKISGKTNERIKINYYDDQEKIAIFYYSNDIEPLFPIAEITVSDNSYVLLNSGVSEKLSLLDNYFQEEELLDKIAETLNEFLEKI